MELNELLTELPALKIQLRAEGGTLRAVCQAGTLGETLKEAIRMHKLALLSRLEEGEAILAEIRTICERFADTLPVLAEIITEVAARCLACADLQALRDARSTARRVLANTKEGAAGPRDDTHAAAQKTFLDDNCRGF